MQRTLFVWKSTSNVHNKAGISLYMLGPSLLRDGIAGDCELKFLVRHRFLRDLVSFREDA